MPKLGRQEAHLDGQREEVDLLKAPDLAILHQAAQLGDGHPLLLILLATATATPPAASTSPPPPSGAEATSETSTARSGVCHSVGSVCQFLC